MSCVENFHIQEKSEGTLKRKFIKRERFQKSTKKMVELEEMYQTERDILQKKRKYTGMFRKCVFRLVPWSWPRPPSAHHLSIMIACGRSVCMLCSLCDLLMLNLIITCLTGQRKTFFKTSFYKFSSEFCVFFPHQYLQCSEHDAVLSVLHTRVHEVFYQTDFWPQVPDTVEKHTYNTFMTREAADTLPGKYGVWNTADIPSTQHYVEKNRKQVIHGPQEVLFE